jgi:hypothetical protein
LMSRPNAFFYTQDLGIPWLWLASSDRQIVSWEKGQGEMVKSALKK